MVDFERQAEEARMNQYMDEWGHHIGYCNGCGEEEELGMDCKNCDEGEIVPYDDDPDPDAS